MRVLWTAPFVLALAPWAAADDYATIQEAKLEGFAQTRAESIEDYHGRAVLIEFFAYW